MAITAATPRIQRSSTPATQPGIIHFGPGAFFRAFNAPYTAEAMAAKGGDWGIRAVSLRHADSRDKLAPQGYAYTSIALTPQGKQHTIIEVINDILVAPEDPAAVLSALADPNIHIISLTITEKGYCHHPASGALQLDHPDILHDLQHPNTPRSAPGFLVYALAQRYAAGLPPLSVLSCDNLPANGVLTRRVVLDFAQAVQPELAAWIAQEGRFPCTMVDRITPATTEADSAQLTADAGYLDQGCVVHEPFRQWVIEDNFVAGRRPDWDAAGAQFIKQRPQEQTAIGQETAAPPRGVAAFETMKLRCLNGTHSTLAYLGYLAGYATIAETVADPTFAALLDQLWTQEIIPTVPPPEGADLTAYCVALKQRYLNPAIQHRTWQIAMDGSQKLPQRLLGTVTDNLAAGRAIPLLSLAVAGWMRYVGGVAEDGQPIEVRDPLAAALRAAVDRSSTPAETVDALLAIQAVFEPTLAANTHFRDAVIAAYTALLQHGAHRTVTQTLEGTSLC